MFDDGYDHGGWESHTEAVGPLYLRSQRQQQQHRIQEDDEFIKGPGHGSDSDSSSYQQVTSAAEMTGSMTYHGAGMASGDETDINSYMASRTTGAKGSSTVRTREEADVRRQKMYTKTSRVYGYRPPRLHEQRSEIRRERYTEGQLSDASPVRVAVKSVEVSSKAWDTRSTQRIPNKKQSVFQPPPQKVKTTPRRPILAAPKVGVGIADDDDHYHDGPAVGAASSYISPSQRNVLQGGSIARPMAADSSEVRRLKGQSEQPLTGRRLPTPLSVKAICNEPSSADEDGEEFLTPQRQQQSQTLVQDAINSASALSVGRSSGLEASPGVKEAVADERAALDLSAARTSSEAALSPKAAPSIPDDEREALASTIAVLEEIIATMSEEHRLRVFEKSTAKSLTNEKKASVSTATAECEVLRAEVKTIERELLVLQNSRKSVVAAMREIEAKDRLIKDMDRMLKAVQGRMEKARAAAEVSKVTAAVANAADEKRKSLLMSASATESALPVYPPGASLKEKTRLAAAARVRVLKLISHLKNERDALKRSTTEKESKVNQAQQQRELQHQRLMAEKEAIHAAYERRELEALNHQLQKLKDDHERTKAHRVRVSKQATSQRGTEMEALALKASQASNGEGDLLRMIGDLQVSLDRHHQDAEASTVERNAAAVVSAELASTLKSIEGKLARRQEELVDQQASIGAVHAQHRVTTEQTKHVNTGLQHDLKFKQDTLRSVTEKADAAQRDLDCIVAAEEKLNFQHEQNIAEFGTPEQLNAKISELHMAIERLSQERTKLLSAFAEDKRRQTLRSDEDDKTIESLTTGLDVRRRGSEKANTRNSDLLQRLDTAERLVAMYNLKQ